MSASDTFETAVSYFEQAVKEARLEFSRSEVRIAKLKTVQALFDAGKVEEAEELLAEVRAEQEALP